MKVGINEVKDILLGETPIVKVYRGEDVIWERSGLPSGYTRVQYLEADGRNQYIDTGITPSNGYGFYVDCMPLTRVATDAASAKIFGSSYLNAGYWGGVVLGTYPTFPTGQFTWFRYGQRIEHMYEPGFESYTRVQMENKNNHFTSSTGKDYDTPYISNSFIHGSLWLFRIHSDVVVTSAGVRIYNFKAYNNNDTVQNFIPCLDQNNTPCFYDTVTGNSYYNQGTGQFGYETMDGTVVNPT